MCAMQPIFSIFGSGFSLELYTCGKRLKGASFLDHITHVVELFAADDRLCLAVEKVPDKTVEKSTLPIRLLA